MKKYGITAHAIDQAVERLGRNRGQAYNELTQLMQTARYQGMDGQARIFDHDKSRTRFILAKDEDVVITVYSMDTEKPAKYYDVKPAVAVEVKPKVNGYNAIIEKAREVIVREIAKASRQFTKEYRELNIEQAELSVEIAQSTVKKFRCKAPHTQLIIQERIDALQRYHDVVQAKLQIVETEYENLTKEAEGYLQ